MLPGENPFPTAALAKGQRNRNRMCGRTKAPWDEMGAQLVKCFPCKHEGLGSYPTRTTKRRVMLPTHNPEVETDGVPSLGPVRTLYEVEVEGCPRLFSDLHIHVHTIHTHTQVHTQKRKSLLVNSCLVPCPRTSKGWQLLLALVPFLLFPATLLRVPVTTLAFTSVMGVKELASPPS